MIQFPIVPPAMLTGILAPVTTPFGDDGAPDLDAYARNLRHYATTALAGVVVLGSNGEAALLSDAESDALIATARDAFPASKWLIAGTGRESTAATVAATTRAAAAGVDAVMVRTPSFYKGRMTPEALAAFYRAVADASPVPVILYNVTVFTGVNLPPETAVALAAHPNVIGIKDSGGDVAVIAALASGSPGGFGVLCGSTAALYPSLCAGATGAVIGPAACAPEACVAVYDAFVRGDHAEARRRQAALVPIARLVGPVWSVAGLKAAVDAAGLTGGPPRPPLLPVTEEGRRAISEEVAKLGVMA